MNGTIRLKFQDTDENTVMHLMRIVSAVTSLIGTGDIFVECDEISAEKMNALEKEEFTEWEDEPEKAV